MARSHTITDWDPENTEQWENGGEKIAKRNLFWSVAAEHVGFSVWSLWSVMVLFMPQDVYGLSTADKFLIGATATLVGSLLRLPYTLATARFGGRNWTVFSAFVLAIPVIATIVILAHPGQPLWVYLLCAALTGFGGGNFASSMTNINAFFPQRLKGWALGLNAGGGNIGVPAVQLVGLLVIATAGAGEPYWVCAVYLVLLAVAGIGAALFMDNLQVPTVDTAAMRKAATDRDTWIVSLLYIGTFGSFIGFSFAFGQVLQATFKAGGATAAEASLQAAQIAFLGPLLGSIARVYGGKLADRIGGGRVTLYVFAGMIAGAGILIAAATSAGTGAPTGATMAAYVAGFIALFLLSGLGNGSVYKMIPSIFEAKSRSLDADEATRTHYSRAMSGAVIGIAGAVGGLGGVGINLVLRASYQASGTATTAFWVFGAFYVVAALVTWKVYVRTPAPSAHGTLDGTHRREPLSTAADT
ncbi:Major facilitator superfamily MFS_1 OS=Tsukamurella paurometabola (strain ATCC 8368 / DSM /CCUG 35730 / CIP 100753 / JCM 10117 / KCTC 9821 / NBRC 16120/ NCIMB 702349 / NCTC 13040) OX=521096 GN=Tpau_1376 PE=3 SV=1 [Tsukamurella paurometabola]|uniref:Major facilitator superfamily MFS_1 n=1 Tax=Tsukamurella paurometabola (strain ATCC 8368 / DSM 20162 / CCUG 35730 / CIP 100753 / JCM 10117 / KCTC 9821 / NBRC 16120 / NCIMB 702349 / NCTC 13040) TaxID=521096 RepID=D5UWY2_TSUPD|nr:nitrate/nitrite transporter [Tsukamurella paurometabola]ADG78004.1 major facilitator superfamily MFS_1 [Tsukamurella paurometabola DSM 20162]SUP29742.1 Nitrite facilitator 1 [Tsukamurella paurometabola]